MTYVASQYVNQKMIRCTIVLPAVIGCAY